MQLPTSSSTVTAYRGPRPGGMGAREQAGNNAVDARTKYDRRGVKVARGTASASALSSPSSPAPAVKEPAAPEQLPALRAQPVGHHVERTRCDHHHGQHGTASINQALGRGSRRALRAPSRGAGRHAAPSSGLRRLDGVLVVRSCARPRGSARAVAAAAPSPRVGAASCRGLGPTVRALGCRDFSARRLGGGRAVAPHERPARMRERRAPESPLHAIGATSSS